MAQKAIELYRELSLNLKLPLNQKQALDTISQLFSKLKNHSSRQITKTNVSSSGSMAQKAFELYRELLVDHKLLPIQE
jgi:hypothetical protein